MKLKKVLAGFMAAVTAVSASVCGLSVSAGAISKTITFIGHDDSIPMLCVYSNEEYNAFISSDYYGGGSVIEIVQESKADMRLMEDIKPTDIVTFSTITDSGEEKILDVSLGTHVFPILTSYSVLGRTQGVFRSGISVQEMIDQYNKDMRSLWDFNNVKDITFKDVFSIYVYDDLNPKDYDNFTWKITIEPGNGKGENSSNDISEAQFTKIKNQTYTGKAIKPSVTVKDGGKKLVNGTDYTLSYKNNTKPGTATVIITGKGNYTGTKTLTFKIVPKKVKVTSKKSGSQAVLSWKKSAGAAGYEIYSSVDGAKFKKLTTTKALKYTAKLTAGKSYKFKVRPYATVNGKKVYGSWSNVVSVK